MLLKAYVKDMDLSAADVSALSKMLMDKPKEELQRLAADTGIPILVSGFAMALLKDMARGMTDSLRWLADRGVGKTPDKIIQVTEDLTLMTPEERDAEIERLYQEHRNKVSGRGNASTVGPAGLSGQPEKTLEEKS